MYSIFFNNRRLQLCRPDSSLCLLPTVTVESLENHPSWEELIVSFQCNTNLRHVVVPVDNPHTSFLDICKNFTIMPAAGGLVTNGQDALLMIYRYGTWDLPKGKQEKGEKLSDTALREVAEETGTMGLKLLGDQLATTFHCYHYKGNNVLKMTAWFPMTASPETTLVPQTEEGIEKAEWVSRKDLEERLNMSYLSIKILVREQYLNDGKNIGKACQIEDVFDLCP
ncbi:MAG: NUDIX domain-containing protein [Bacteroidales bacterium]|nr:NUDIX domain-containing protein [Bacteroidales bacterium]MDD4030440.1 NUDIX domain-containing protein [Bacteroidales bacterium]MDD4435405.1 NUDIX domain-containing protein [Bacteroidales bacterium]MDD5733189.1 NUDIX domain-containing protein [Bacteroidales bacterium]